MFIYYQLYQTERLISFKKTVENSRYILKLFPFCRYFSKMQNVIVCNFFNITSFLLWHFQCIFKTNASFIKLYRKIKTTSRRDVKFIVSPLLLHFPIPKFHVFIENANFRFMFLVFPCPYSIKKDKLKYLIIDYLIRLPKTLLFLVKI